VLAANLILVLDEGRLVVRRTNSDFVGQAGLDATRYERQFLA
jgi:hypothetical protein